MQTTKPTKHEETGKEAKCTFYWILWVIYRNCDIEHVLFDYMNPIEMSLLLFAFVAIVAAIAVVHLWVLSYCQTIRCRVCARSEFAKSDTFQMVSVDSFDGNALVYVAETDVRMPMKTAYFINAEQPSKREEIVTKKKNTKKQK